VGHRARARSALLPQPLKSPHPRYFDFNVLTTKNSKKIRYIHRNPSPVQAVHEPRSHFGNSQKNIFKKRKKITAQIRALKSPQSTINSPQTHHDFTIKKHHIFTAHSQKSPQKPRKPVPEKKSQKQIPRR
jgi:hypothetical protein